MCSLTTSFSNGLSIVVINSFLNIQGFTESSSAYNLFQYEGLQHLFTFFLLNIIWS